MIDLAKQLLKDLGPDPARIANRLRELGIKGRRKHPCRCPMTNLFKHYGIQNSEITESQLWIGNEACDLPFGPKEFIREFDAGHYPDLSEEPTIP